MTIAAWALSGLAVGWCGALLFVVLVVRADRRLPPHESSRFEGGPRFAAGAALALAFGSLGVAALAVVGGLQR